MSACRTEFTIMEGSFIAAQSEPEFSAGDQTPTWAKMPTIQCLAVLISSRQLSCPFGRQGMPFFRTSALAEIGRSSVDLEIRARFGPTLKDATSMRRHIQCLRRGAVVRMSDAAPHLTILDYLRLNEGATGTKEGCAEGDCGACTVVLRRRVGGRLVYVPVNACIALVGQADGADLISVEDLVHEGRLHPVQQALVDFHGSQCGFCTPGFVMSLFALFHAPSAPTLPSPRGGGGGGGAGAATRSMTGSREIYAAAPVTGRSSTQPLRRVPPPRIDLRNTNPRPPARWPCSTMAMTCSRAHRSASSRRRQISTRLRGSM